jgi:hypothetical protein
MRSHPGRVAIMARRGCVGLGLGDRKHVGIGEVRRV